MLGALLRTIGIVGLIVGGVGFMAALTTYLYGASGSAQPHDGDVAVMGAPSDHARERASTVLGVSLMVMGASLVLVVGGVVLARQARADAVPPPPAPPSLDGPK